MDLTYAAGSSNALEYYTLTRRDDYEDGHYRERWINRDYASQREIFFLLAFVANGGSTLGRTASRIICELKIEAYLDAYTYASRSWADFLSEHCSLFDHLPPIATRVLLANCYC